MGTTQNWTAAYSRVQQRFNKDLRRSIELLEKHCPIGSPEWIKGMNANGQRIAAQAGEQLRALGTPPWLPSYHDERLPEVAASDPGVIETYYRIRRALWTWPEFIGLRPGARAILETVIELARDQVFPWYLPVQAMEVRRLARLAEGSYTRCARELDLLVVTRPGRMCRPLKPNTDAHAGWWNARPDQVPVEDHCENLPQFVVRYRRGIPWNRKRAAWWINYDLLCQTGRVQPMFVAILRRLPKPYLQRNRAMGRVNRNDPVEHWHALNESFSERGPRMEPGFRTPRWILPRPPTTPTAPTAPTAPTTTAATAPPMTLVAPVHTQPSVLLTSAGAAAGSPR